VLRQVYRSLSFFGVAAGFIVAAALGRLLIWDPRRRRRFLVGAVSRAAARALKSFDISVRAVNLPMRSPAGKPFFIVANHTSDVDIPVLASVLPVVFLAAVDVGETAFIGTLTRLGGIVLVERRRKSAMRTELDEVRQVLRDGFDVALFPEGGTSNGESVQPFKSGLFQAAIDAEALLLPVCINYLSVGGQKLSAANRDQVLYYGDMGFSDHLHRMLSAGTIEVECRFLPPFPLMRYDSRKQICERVRRAILAQQVPVI
jgi:1-acyl-sn-glycerol-3-phosphate acyltransferase